MSSESIFIEVSLAIDLTADKNDVTHTNFNCKAVEVTEVIEKVNSKKSGRKNHRRRRRIKKNHDVPNNSNYRFAAINYIFCVTW